MGTAEQQRHWPGLQPRVKAGIIATEPGLSDGLPLEHHYGSRWRFGDFCLVVFLLMHSFVMGTVLRCGWVCAFGLLLGRVGEEMVIAMECTWYS